jgi:hypothetical protein
MVGRTRKYKEIKKYKQTKKKREKPFKKLNCSPNKKLSYTCYSPNSLLKLKQEWNKDNPDKKIYTNNTYEIWEHLKDNMNKNCNNEKCWLKQDFISDNLDNSLTKYTFAPNAPPTWKKNPNEWLNSNDLINVMKQYEKTYTNFKFIGPSPIDFNKKKMFGQCVWNDLCNFNLKNLLHKGITKIGIILNTDPHYLSGSHWICIFINMEKDYIYYFDSNADRTPRQVRKFLNKVSNQAKRLNINIKEYINTTEHQKGNTECGMYVLYIIITLLTTNIEPYFSKRISDKQVEKLRKIFFNN